MFAAVVTPAFAGPGVDPNPNNGHDSGYVPPGYEQATLKSSCAEDGLFNFFSHGYIPTYYGTPVGSEQLGVDKSARCGERQGNLP